MSFLLATLDWQHTLSTGYVCFYSCRNKSRILRLVCFDSKCLTDQPEKITTFDSLFSTADKKNSKIRHLCTITFNLITPFRHDSFTQMLFFKVRAWSVLIIKIIFKTFVLITLLYYCVCDCRKDKPTKNRYKLKQWTSFSLDEFHTICFVDSM